MELPFCMPSLSSSFHHLQQWCNDAISNGLPLLTAKDQNQNPFTLHTWAAYSNLSLRLCVVHSSFVASHVQLSSHRRTTKSIKKYMDLLACACNRWHSFSRQNMIYSGMFQQLPIISMEIQKLTSSRCWILRLLLGSKALSLVLGCHIFLKECPQSMYCGVRQAPEVKCGTSSGLSCSHHFFGFLGWDLSRTKVS